LDDSVDHIILSWSIGLLLGNNRTLDRTFTVSSLIDRTLSRTIDQTNALGSIGIINYDRSYLLSIMWWSIELVLRIIIDQTTKLRSDVWSNLHYIEFDRSNSIMINQINAIDYIGSSIDNIILLWSIILVHYNQLDVRSNLHYVKFDRLTLSRLIRLMHKDRFDVRSVEEMH
jgi:hypothetical protein